MLEFTKTGMTVDTFDDIYQRVAAKLKEAYHLDIDIDPNTPDGQRIGIQVKEMLDSQSFLSVLYSQMDPDFSFGVFQEVLFKICGITKYPARQSTADLSVVTDRALTIPAGYLVKDLNSTEWQTLNEYQLLAGTSTISVSAKEYGAIEAPQDTITEPVTIVLGVQSITNPQAATVGRDEEKEADARRRRNKSLENPAYSTLGAVISKIAGIEGVTDVVGYENETDVYDSVKDLGAHSMWLVVQGGDVALIAENIAKQKTGGTPLKGSTSATYVETLDLFEGRQTTITHKMKFDRPTPIRLYVKCNAKRTDPAQPVDTDLIAQNIASKQFFIADYLQAGELYQPAYTAGGNFILSDMLISTDGATYTDERLFSGYGGLFTLSVDDVVVTEVIP